MRAHQLLGLACLCLALAGCAVKSVDKDAIANVKTVGVEAYLVDELAGRRRNMLSSDEIFNPIRLDWDSAGHVNNLTKRWLEKEQYKVSILKPDAAFFRSDAKKYDHDTISAHVRDLALSSSADSFLIIFSAQTQLGGEAFTYGMGGALGAIIGEAVSSRFSGYALESRMGNSYCYHNYFLYFADRSGKILGYKFVRADKDEAIKLQKPIFANDNGSISAENLALIKPDCLRVFDKNVQENLNALGLSHAQTDR